MLSQRLEVSLKSQTLPRLDGQDEEGEALENQFEILSLANSCPDLTVLELESRRCETDTIPILTSTAAVDEVDCIFYRNQATSSIPPCFRRSTSLSSLGADGNLRGPATTISGNRVSVLNVGPVSKGIGQLGKALKKEIVCQQSSTEFLRTNLRASHGGVTGYLHKSISSPSVTCQNFGGLSAVPGEHPSKSSRAHQSDAHQHSSKRSFFRRKQKSKGHLLNSNPAVFLNSNNNSKMDVFTTSVLALANGDTFPSSGLTALTDPGLGLQDYDAECWALSMSSEIVSQLEDKEVKRQEHMYELILTEKHHCLTLALMQHLFVGGMKRSGFRHQSRLLFPDLNKLLEVHFSLLRQMRERQQKFRDLGQPMDTLADILLEQFTSDQWQLMIRLYGLLCASHAKSLEIFKSLLKDQKFASLVAGWDKEPLLSRKNVRECLLLVAQRITKYPLLFEPLLKTSASVQEKEQISKALIASKDLISKVNERVAERQRLIEICQRIDPKSHVTFKQKRRGREEIVSNPARRLLFHGQAFINRVGTSNISGGAPGSLRNAPCTVLIMTDSLVFVQEFSGRLNFVTPPGMVMLNNLIIRTNAGQNSSLFLVPVTGTAKPEMIDLQVIFPPNRAVWMDQIKNAITNCEEETETFSDDDESIDAAEYSDLKTTKALEELQEQDKQLLILLRSRARLIDSLRTERPHAWLSNNFDGKDSLLHSLTGACTEVQRVISHWESNPNSSVIRSTSCVGEYGVSGNAIGLPKRADTFGGFDSQQRSALELPQSANSKLLFEIVVHLSELCGEMFSQMVPHLMPNIYQSQNQLQRRMEDLREAQQRLETEKALWQQELSSEKETMDKERNELTSWKNSLQKEQDDIIQQREQLYRKLEALQKQGIRPPLDPISPLSGNANNEKAPSTTGVTRRPSQSQQPPPYAATNGQNAASGVKSKQQLPLHLASSSFKANRSSVSSTDLTNPTGKVSSVGLTKGSSFSTVPHVSPVPQSTATTAVQNQVPRAPVQNRSGNSQSSIQQMLPLRLSEGNSSKTSSLPRGVGSRSVSSMMNQMDCNAKLQSSGSPTNFPQSTGDGLHQVNSSFLYGPANTRDAMRSNSSGQGSKPTVNNGYENFAGSSANPHETIQVLHQRSGSSPIPMSSAPVKKTTAPEIHYHQHPFFKPRDDDSESKILFL